MRKYFLCSLGCLGIAMAFYAGIWTWLCERTGLISWIGFAGCTTYFACGEKNFRGMALAAVTNVSGVVWAMFSIVIGRIWDRPYGTAVLCAFISYMIIMQAKIKGLGFIPGAYIGCFITFAAEGDWKAVLPAIVLGPVLGWLTEISGNKLYQIAGAKEEMDITKI